MVQSSRSNSSRRAHHGGARLREEVFTAVHRCVDERIKCWRSTHGREQLLQQRVKQLG